MHVNEYLDTLKQLTGVNSDVQLAERIGVAKQTISTWRRRGNVPLSVELRLADELGPEASFSNEFRYAHTSRERQAILAVFLSLYDANKGRCDPVENRDRYLKWSQAFLHCEGEITDAIRKIGFVSQDSFTMAEMIRTLIERGGLPSVAHALDVFLAESDNP